MQKIGINMLYREHNVSKKFFNKIGLKKRKEKMNTSRNCKISKIKNTDSYLYF